jgi:hypothetical protein
VKRKTMLNTKWLEVFTEEYIAAMLFTECPDSDRQPGEFRGSHAHRKWSRRMSNATVDLIQRDCLLFYALASQFFIVNPADMDSDEDSFWETSNELTERAARDFWYTRNGHGCGFWDGDWDWECEQQIPACIENKHRAEGIGGLLTTISKRFGEVYVEFGRGGWIDYQTSLCLEAITSTKHE